MCDATGLEYVGLYDLVESSQGGLGGFRRSLAPKIQVLKW